jgi:hypothetical protein
MASVSAASLIYHGSHRSSADSVGFGRGLEVSERLSAQGSLAMVALAVVLDSALVHDPDYPDNQLAPKSEALLHAVGGSVVRAVDEGDRS